MLPIFGASLHSVFIVAVLKGHVTLSEDPDQLEAETKDSLKNLLETAADLGANHRTKSNAGTLYTLNTKYICFSMIFESMKKGVHGPL